MQAYIPQQKEEFIERIFILGAGFSKAIVPESPLLKELFINLLPSLPELKKLADEYKTDNIEKIITEIDREIILKGNESLRAIKEKIRDKTNDLFLKLASGIKKYDNDTAIRFCNLLKEKDIIITLNYDTFLEQYLSEKYEKWSPFGGYTPIVKTMFEPSNPNGLNEKRKNIFILKPHGSINFNEALVGGTENERWIGLEIANNIFPSYYCHYGYGGENITKALQLPSYFHQSYPKQLNALWHIAYECIKISKHIVIIGYSIPDEDGKAYELISFIEYDPKLENRKITIINGGDSEATKKKIEKTMWYNPKGIDFEIKGYLSDALPELEKSFV